MNDLAVVDRSNLREVAARVAARAEFRDVRLFKTNAVLERMPPAGVAMTYQLDSNVEVQYEPGDESFALFASYRLAVAEADPTIEDHDQLFADDRIVARLTFTLGGLFTLEMRDGDERPSAEELEAYASTTGQFAIYPFAREYIYDLTGRLSLPPLTVGVLRLDLPQPK